MNSLYYGVLWRFFFFINFIISGEMTSFSLDDEGNSFSSSLSPLVTLSRKYVSLAYLYQFLLFLLFFTSFIYQFLLRLSPWKYCTSWFSSFTIYYNCAVVVAVAVRFLVLTRVVSLVLILIECNTQKFEGIDARPFFNILKVLWLHQKEILTQRAHFQGIVLIVQIIGYVVSMSFFKATIHKTKHSKA